MFKTDLVRISFVAEERGVWRFGGNVSTGTAFTYDVEDENYWMRNRWQFSVQVPDAWTKGNYINVRPLKVPNRRMWAGLDRRVISLQRATIGRHGGKVYAKLSISDVHGEKTKVVLRKDAKRFMPRWLKSFSPIQKQRVSGTDANDGEHLVAVMDRNNHIHMIKLFLALKAWVLDEGYDPKEWRQVAARRRLREKQARLAGALRGKVVTITGALGYGPRWDVSRWLRKLGASVASHVTSKTDLLLVGAHYKGDDRQKIRYAKKHGVPMLAEARFRERFSV
jgi:hypothetical protein